MPRTRLCVAVALLAAAVGLGAWAAGPLDELELDTVDARFAVRGEQPPPEGIVLVLVDDVSFDELGEQWPFPRSLHARLIDRLRRAGAGSIAYDVQFTEPTTPREDGALLEAVARMGGVTLATSEVDARGRSNVFGGESVLREVGARAGHSDLAPDRGATLRRMPYEVGGLRSFAVVAAEAASGRPIERSALPEGEPWIDFRGGPGTIPAVSFSRVLSGRFPPGFFRGKTVVVGAAAPSLQDVHPTSTGAALMAGPEVQAEAIATALRGFPLRSAPGWLEALAIVLMAAAVPLASLRVRLLWALGLAAALALAYPLLAQASFEAGTVLSVVYPLLALATAALGTLAVHYAIGAFERVRTREAFSRFVPATVVAQVLARGDGELRLGGVRQETTVLFSDIRGFTTLSERLPPEEVVEILNRYLTGMTEAIMGHGGTLASYIGDGIMAVFGAPLEQPDHADRALAAAREMVGPRMAEFNAWVRERGHEELRMGVGLNSGDVMAGNVGSPQRMDYTAIGDTCNTAARLEGLTKGSGYQVYAAKSTRDLASEGWEELLEPCGALEVRGREGTIEVWGLREPADV